MYTYTCNKTGNQTQVAVLNCNDYRIIYVIILYKNGYCESVRLGVV